MGFGVRLEPVRVNSRGSVGVNVGPFSAYSRGGGDGSGGGGFAYFLVCVLIGAVVVAVRWGVEHPAYGLPGLAALIVLVVYGRRLYVEYERQQDELRQQRVQEWLDGPAPTFTPPSRFTEKYLATEVPAMHPKQLKPFVDSMRARSWDDRTISTRLAPHLASNPFVEVGALEESLRSDSIVDQIVENVAERAKRRLGAREDRRE